MENDFAYTVWQITVNFLFFKAVKKHLHEVHIYDGYKHFYIKGTNPYLMADILVNNMEDYIEGTGDSECSECSEYY